MVMDKPDAPSIEKVETLADKIFNLGSNLNIKKEEIKDRLNYSFLRSIWFILDNRTAEEIGYLNMLLDRWIGCHEIKLKEDGFLWLSMELSKQYKNQYNNMYESTKLSDLSAKTIVNQANIEKIKNTYVMQRKVFFYNILGIITQHFNDLIETKRYFFDAAEINYIKGDIKGLYITKKGFETIFEAYQTIVREYYSHSAYKGSRYVEESEYTLDLICYFAKTLCRDMVNELERNDAFWEKNTTIYDDLVKDNKRLLQKLEENSQITSQIIDVADKEIATFNKKIDKLKKAADEKIVTFNEKINELEKNEDKLNKRITSLEDELKKARAELGKNKDNPAQKELGIEDKIKAIETKENEIKERFEEIEKLEKKYERIEEEYNKFRKEKQMFDKYVAAKEKKLAARERMLKDHQSLAIIIQTSDGKVIYNDVAMKAYKGEQLISDDADIKYDVFLTQGRIPVSVAWKYKIPLNKKGGRYDMVFVGIVDTAEYFPNIPTKK